MKLVDEVFKRYVFNKQKIANYDFLKIDDGYYLEKEINNGNFILKIKIVNDKISANLIDKEFGDEFNQINIENINNSFIANLKEECKNVLIDIRCKCFDLQLFIYPQTNRITNLIKEKYNVDPEFLWEDSPGCAIFRNHLTKKWFGIIMNVNKNKLVKDTDCEVEVINLKLDNLVNDYLKIDGIYPSYHMTKKNWVSIILDDKLDDKYIMDLINISFDNVCNK